eukprot:TRINITY_DN8477_c0_g1_i1.p1 TRINITY_DN8477_c0_g1~~TRINITY_DN8477_c0_g1_i1.p1  ORF type:complete len:223 (+),score=65.17 TRINITY_DN8477_c0_g1_i1:342-1010(+)
MDQIKSKLGQWELREWRDFADIGRFKLPTGATLQPRVVTNVQYYAVNYLVIALAALLVVVLFRPLILVVLAAEGAFVGYLYSAARVPDGLILLPAPLASLSGRRTVPRILLVIASAGVSLLLMLIFGGVVLLMGYIVGAGAILMHAAMRQRSTKSKLTTFVGAETGGSDLQGTLLGSVAEAVMADVEDLESAPMAAREELEEHRARYHELRDHLREKYADKQ